MDNTYVGILTPSIENPEANLLPHNGLILGETSPKKNILILVYSKEQARQSILQFTANEDTQKAELQIAASSLPEISSTACVELRAPAANVLMGMFLDAKDIIANIEITAEPGIITMYITRDVDGGMAAVFPVLHRDDMREVYVLYSLADISELIKKCGNIVSQDEKSKIYTFMRDASFPGASDTYRKIFDGFIGNILFRSVLLYRKNHS